MRFADVVTPATKNRDPDPKAEELIAMLRRWIHDNLAMASGLGGDEMIETVIKTTISSGEKNVVSTQMSTYSLESATTTARFANISQGTNFSVNANEFIAETTSTKHSFLCTPNSPTKTGTDVDDVERVLPEIQDVLFLDNAYVGFFNLDYPSLLEKYDDLVTGKTFSKVCGPADLWISYGFIPTWLESPFQAVTISMIVDTTCHDSFIVYVRKWHKTFVREIPSSIPAPRENSVQFGVTSRTRNEVMKACAETDILVRSCTSFPNLGETFVRELIENVQENEQFFAEGECS